MLGAGVFLPLLSKQSQPLRRKCWTISTSSASLWLMIKKTSFITSPSEVERVTCINPLYVMENRL